jgi:hypothetical protein
MHTLRKLPITAPNASAPVQISQGTDVIASGIQQAVAGALHSDFWLLTSDFVALASISS